MQRFLNFLSNQLVDALKCKTTDCIEQINLKLEFDSPDCPFEFFHRHEKMTFRAAYYDQQVEENVFSVFSKDTTESQVSTFDRIGHVRHQSNILNHSATLPTINFRSDLYRAIKNLNEILSEVNFTYLLGLR